MLTDRDRVGLLNYGLLLGYKLRFGGCFFFFFTFTKYLHLIKAPKPRYESKRFVKSFNEGNREEATIPHRAVFPTVCQELPSPLW